MHSWVHIEAQTCRIPSSVGPTCLSSWAKLDRWCMGWALGRWIIYKYGWFSLIFRVELLPWVRVIEVQIPIGWYIHIYIYVWEENNKAILYDQRVERTPQTYQCTRNFASCNSTLPWNRWNIPSGNDCYIAIEAVASKYWVFPLKVVISHSFFVNVYQRLFELSVIFHVPNLRRAIAIDKYEGSIYLRESIEHGMSKVNSLKG